MPGNERTALETLAEALSRLPAERQDYILGYAEGVLAASDRQKETEGEEGNR